YHINFALKLEYGVVGDRLQRAFDAALDRHPALFMRFVEADGDFRQEQADKPVLTIEAAETEQEALVDALAARAAQPFDLAEAPLRASFISTPDGGSVFFLCCHHILCDGWAIQRFLNDVDAFYHALPGDANEIARASAEFGRTVAWAAGLSDGAAALGAGDFWRAVYERPPPPLVFRGVPGDQVGLGAAGATAFSLEDAVYRRFRKAAADVGVTPASALTAATSALIARLHAETADLSIAMPFHGRLTPVVEDVTSFLANTVALRCRPHDGLEFSTYARVVSASMRDAERHQLFGIDRLVEALNLGGRPTPLCQAMLAYQRVEGARRRFAGVAASPLFVPVAHAKYPLTLVVDDDGERLSGRLEYARAAFSDQTARQWTQRLVGILEQTAENPDRRLGDFNVSIAADRVVSRRLDRADAKPARTALSQFAAFGDQRRRIRRAARRF
ncbi:MAG: condensation domain-containing protein, partial [Pseudomonadota bacterium]